MVPSKNKQQNYITWVEQQKTTHLGMVYTTYQAGDLGIWGMVYGIVYPHQVHIKKHTINNYIYIYVNVLLCLCN